MMATTAAIRICFAALELESGSGMMRLTQPWARILAQITLDDGVMNTLSSRFSLNSPAAHLYVVVNMLWSCCRLHEHGIS
jgi:hypothetical protein